MKKFAFTFLIVSATILIVVPPPARGDPIQQKVDETVNLLENELAPVVDYAIEWSTVAAMGLVSSHAFLAICKRFLE